MSEAHLRRIVSENWAMLRVSITLLSFLALLTIGVGSISLAFGFSWQLLGIAAACRSWVHTSCGWVVRPPAYDPAADQLVD